MNFQVRGARVPRLRAARRGIGSFITCASPPHPPPSQLTGSSEYIDGQFAGALGEVLIRCNNVLYVRAAAAGEIAPAT